MVGSPAPHVILRTRRLLWLSYKYFTGIAAGFKIECEASKLERSVCQSHHFSGLLGATHSSNISCDWIIGPIRSIFHDERICR